LGELKELEEKGERMVRRLEKFKLKFRSLYQSFEACESHKIKKSMKNPLLNSSEVFEQSKRNIV
jgi:predicted nuclease with TOPRIM domain